jgi:hypothetical protein
MIRTVHEVLLIECDVCGRSETGVASRLMADGWQQWLPPSILRLGLTALATEVLCQNCANEVIDALDPYRKKESRC